MEKEKAAKRNSDINLKVNTIFLFDQEKVRQEDHHLFDIPREVRLNHTWDQKRLWIASVNAAIIETLDTLTTTTPTEHQLTPDATDSLGDPRSDFTPQDPPLPVIYDGRRPRVRLR